MIYTEQTKKALRLCFDAHRDQKDKSGLPYVFHPFHVAEQMRTEDETVTALLHDVVEDTAYTLEDLRAMGFSRDAMEALKVITHDKDENYLEHICRVACNPIAKTVKLADLAHNSNLNRLEQVTERDRNRVKKYTIARALLHNGSCGENGLFSCTLPLNADLSLTMEATAHAMVAYALQKGERIWRFDPAKARELETKLGLERTLPELLVEYDKEHDLGDLF